MTHRVRCTQCSKRIIKDNKNPDSSPVSVIWERNCRDCIQQHRYTFCFNSLILYRVSVPGTICTPHQFSIDQVHKHSETALDTPKKEGTESSFPVKVHAIPGKTSAICKIFVVQMWCKIQKKNRKSLKIKDLRFKVYPEPRSK